jgi:phage baseplate assembly protein W
MKTKSRYSDIDIDFGKNKFTKDLSIARNLQAIQQSVLSIILTSPGEKPFNPGFGVGIYNLLFEILTDTDVAILGNSMQKQLEIFEPRVTFESVKIDDSVPFFLDITLNYIVNTITDEPVPQTINLKITKVR